uniref:acylaminoacyl-peptidase n=1 Tax=Pygocentrus nattereri TaxID=42514 RepID=A0AAR2IPU7_PYGNA
LSFSVFRLLSSHSPSGARRVVIWEANNHGVGHQYLEVWGCNGLEKSLDLTALNKHGKVYDDAQFACLAWSPCEDKLLYVAEKKRVGPLAQASFLSANESRGLVVLEEEVKHTFYFSIIFLYLCLFQDKNVYVEDWGEGLTGKSAPVLCVADLSKGEVTICTGVPPHISPGQALWAGDGNGLIFLGWWHEPFRLGLKFCSNRRSALFYIDLKGNCELLSSDSGSVLSPRLSPDRLWLVYLQGQVFGPHHQCLSMMLVNALSLSHLHTQGQNYSELIVSSLLLLFMLFGSAKLLTVMKDLMVMSCSSPNRPPSLKKTISSVSTIDMCNGVLPNMKHSVQPPIPPPPPQPLFLLISFSLFIAGLNFGAVLLKPESTSKRVKFPLVVFIHGGPHSHFAAEWNVNAAALTKLGFAVLMVNYRGSTGFGQDSIDSLLGNIGSQDVRDVQRAVLHVLQSNAILDADRVAVMGGSHGGFLACHLIGQYPEFYRACAARNPVINAATLLGTSDIIDWRYSSIGLQYSFDQLPTPQALTTMLEKSPITHAAQIRTPVLLMLGGKDKRVSPYQGLELYKALKSRNSPVRYTHTHTHTHTLLLRQIHILSLKACYWFINFTLCKGSSCTHTIFVKVFL